MKSSAVRALVGMINLSLVPFSGAWAARDAGREKVELRAFVNDSCIVADEPYFLPAPPKQSNGQPGTAKFLPLLGLVVGKLAELFINHEIQKSADRMKTKAARKDTHYAASKQMNLYRADFEPEPVLGLNAHLGCMTIIAANFKPDPVECTKEYLPKTLAPESVDAPQEDWKTSRTDSSIENQLRRADVCVDGTARAVYEARFEFSKDHTAYRLRDAGYHVAALLTADEKSATRTTIYTLRISIPGATEQQETLSSAWVNVGSVTAGSQSSGAKSDSAPWLRVPPLSTEARRIYDEKTKVHQEVIGEIQALKRASTRNQRLLANLDQRIATASPDVIDGLKQERIRIAVLSQSQAAELETREAEYQDLPRATLELMPVTIEVAVTETESEKKAQLALADIIGKNSDVVGSAVGNAASGLLSKSVKDSDIILADDVPTNAVELERTRADYFDALIETQGAAAGTNHDEAQRRLAAAKAKYNDARRTVGLERLD